jgi:hypothetical protein
MEKNVNIQQKLRAPLQSLESIYQIKFTFEVKHPRSLPYELELSERFFSGWSERKNFTERFLPDAD